MIGGCIKKKLFIIIFVLPIFIFSQEYTLGLFTSRSKKDAFWGPFARFAQETAKDLDLGLKTFYAKGDHMLMLEQVKKACKKSSDIDGLIIHNFKNLGQKFLEIAEKHKVPVIVVNAGIGKVGKPRQKYKYWIGEILPNNFMAGYKLANTLFRNYGIDNKQIRTVGISGPKASPDAKKRNNGFRKAVSQHDNVTLCQILPTNWSIKQAEYKFKILKRIRYPKISVVWTAADIISLGVYKGAKELDLGMDKIVTGGIDWSSEGIKSVEEGKINATVGGHFMEGGWAVILFHDYFKGHDFKEEAICFKSGMSVITKADVKKKSQFLKPKTWQKIDFKKFSKIYNDNLDKYHFNFSAIREQLESRGKH